MLYYIRRLFIKGLIMIEYEFVCEMPDSTKKTLVGKANTREEAVQQIKEFCKTWNAKFTEISEIITCRKES